MATDQARFERAESVEFDPDAYLTPALDFLLLLAVIVTVAVASVAIITV